MPCHICDICMVSLHCEYYCIQTVSLQNDFVCVLLGVYYSANICHILCTCIYQCEYTCDHSVHSVMKSISHTEYMNTSVQCVCSCEPSYVSLQWTVCHTLYTHAVLASHHVDGHWCHCYQLCYRNFLHMHKVTLISVHIQITLKHYVSVNILVAVHAFRDDVLSEEVCWR